MQCRTKPMIGYLLPDVVWCGLIMTVKQKLQRMKRHIRSIVLVFACSATMHAMAADKFRQDLDKFIKNTLKQDYSGKGAPRLVLFSPIAQEKHLDPNFPDPTANNQNIKFYADAMAEVSKINSVQFVDLFMVSQQLYA